MAVELLEHPALVVAQWKVPAFDFLASPTRQCEHDVSARGPVRNGRARHCIGLK